MQSTSTILWSPFMILISPVINLVFKPPEHHRFVHLLTGIDAFNDQMTEGIGNIDQAPPWMFPLKSSAKVEGMLCLLKDIEENKDRSVSQKKSGHKSRRKDSSQDRKNGRIGSRGQKQNYPRGATEDF